MKAKKLTKETISSLGIVERPFPQFRPGDSIRVSLRIKEGDKERIQDFEGDVILIRNHGISSTFTVRKIGANSIPVERIFPLYSPLIADIVLVRKGDVRKAKLFYMRSRIGKAARTAKVLRNATASAPVEQQVAEEVAPQEVTPTE